MRQVPLPGELLHQFSLPFIEILRYFDCHPDQLVSPFSIDRQAFARYPKHCPGLRSGRYGQLDPAVDGAHAHPASQGGLGDIDRHLAVQVTSLAAEEVMFTDPDGDDQITGRRPSGTRASLSAQANVIAFVDAGGDLQGDFSHPLDLSPAAAGVAWLADDLAPTVAPGARPVDGESALGEGKISLTLTFLADRGPGARLGSGTLTDRTGLLQRHADQGLPAGDGRLEGDLDLRMKVLAPPGSRSR